MVDLKGRAVIPGLIDNHTHQYNAALIEFRGVDLVGVQSLAEMLDRLRQAAGKAKPGETIVTTGGWDQNHFPEKRGPNKKDLDAAVPDNPVFLFQSGRNADFVILDADVMTVPEDKVKDLHPLATYVGARKVYAKAGGGF